MDIEEIVKRQKEFFVNTMPDIDLRKEKLRKLRLAIKKHEPGILAALRADFNKNETDSYLTEISIVYHEIKVALKNLGRWARPEKVMAGIANFPAKCRVYRQPYGVVLIMAPWNYPFMLSVSPLVAAVAAGNCVVLKPSNYTKAVSVVLQTIIGEVFEPEYVSVILGGREENSALLGQRFDYIFFTGGITVGKLVLESAAKFLTPVTLELGGKSPCIVDYDCDLDSAARRIVWGKFLNAGQTCVAPDYVWVHKSVHKPLVEKIIGEIQKQFYIGGVLSEDFPHVITDKHAGRLSGYIDKEKLVFGGTADGRRMEPAILDNVSFSDPVMQDEIFGPVLPVLEFEDIDDVIQQLHSMEKPLALYYFGKSAADRIIRDCRYGGGCINDVVMHAADSRLPFGGVGASGMGQYHGKAGFDTFSRRKSVVHKGKAEIKLRYMPHTEKKGRFLRKIL